jgi:Uma2 family endonuclease
MSSVARRLSWRDFLRLPADDLRHELVRGELLMTPPAGSDHGSLVAEFAALLRAHVRPRRLGWVMVEPAVRLAEDICFGPDVAFLGRERRAVRRATHLAGAPDLVVEVLSPSTRAFDRGEKLALYRKHGVRECWLVDAVRRTIDVHDFRTGTRQVARSPFQGAVLPDLVVDPAAVFSVLDD